MWIAVIAITLALLLFTVYFVCRGLLKIFKSLANIETFAQVHGRLH
jgi:hypothetical protein